MTTIRHHLACIALLTPLLASAQERALTPDDISATWVNQAAIGTTTTGTPVELRLQADGAASMVVGATVYSGTWQLFEKGFCTTWKKIRANQERCYSGVVKDSVVTIFNPDGSPAGKYTEFR